MYTIRFVRICNLNTYEEVKMKKINMILAIVILYMGLAPVSFAITCPKSEEFVWDNNKSIWTAPGNWVQENITWRPYSPETEQHKYSSMQGSGADVICTYSTKGGDWVGSMPMRQALMDTSGCPAAGTFSLNLNNGEVSASSTNSSGQNITWKTREWGGSRDSGFRSYSQPQMVGNGPIFAYNEPEKVDKLICVYKVQYKAKYQPDKSSPVSLIDIFTSIEMQIVNN